MADDTSKVPPVPGVIKVAPGSSELAPFVYFDGATTYGVNAGAIQIELGANTVLPDGIGGTRIDIVITAHLRCSPAAAAGLRDAIDRALAMLQQGAQQMAEPAPGSKPN